MAFVAAGGSALGSLSLLPPTALGAVAVLARLDESLELHHHLLARKVLLVALLEVEGAVVERLREVLSVRRGENNDDARCVLALGLPGSCLLYTSPSPRDRTRCPMPSSA